MTIQVTQKDIRLGHISRYFYGNIGSNCPIARAIKRKTNNENVNVGQNECRLDEIDYFPLPLVAKEFINKFDSFDSVYPFNFELDIPEYT